jgi:alcohol dehydrogenase
VDEVRLPEALRFGADLALAAERGQLAEQILQLTAGRGVDLAIELSGSASAFEMGLPLLRIGGRYVLVGAVAPTKPVPLEPEMLVRRQLTLFGVHNYGPRDLVTAVRFLELHHAAFPFQELVGGCYTLDQADLAIQEAALGKTARVAIVFPNEKLDNMGPTK